ncbi:MAG: UvrD-helicase domain-containing protein [Bacteroidetes bacterium]|nr:UvrD-helicase domain-containing protein [Bacteroidota bacterium]
MFTDLTPQQIKALDFKHSISLKANAGSGKTFVLSKRYLQIAIKGAVPLQNIAAITFTDKAAGELYKRIAEEIEKQICLSADNSERIKLEKIRRQLVSANISTIHSFCINILREFPVDAELDANFTPIDANESYELLELSIEETLKEKFEDTSNEEIKYLIRLFGSKVNLVKQLRTLIDNRKSVLKLKNNIYSEDVEKIAGYFRESFNKYFQIIYLPQIKSLIKDLTTINNKVIDEDPDNELSNDAVYSIKELTENSKPEEVIKIIHRIIEIICIKDNKIRKANYLIAGLREGFEEEINNVENVLNDLSKIEFNKSTKSIEHQLALAGKYLINLFDDTLFLYDQKKRELGYLDYEDILINTRTLLQSENVSKYLSDKFKYLMVDEYQDTNEIQYEIFMPILDYLKKGNLFIVGDEKQSIYRFREAELEVFNKTNLDISNKDGSEYLITLPDSFRMEPDICLFTNVLFKKLFHNPDKLYNEVEHSELICAKSDNTGGKVSILIAEDNSDIIEAELISRQILKLLNENPKIDWNDIAILVRKRNAFKGLEKQFVKFKIPYKIIGGRGFFHRQSIYDIYNYFSFLLDTNNDAALIGILRSPFFSMSDLKIFEVSLKYGHSFWEKMLESKSEDEQVDAAVKQLRQYLQLAGKKDFNTLLTEIFETTNFLTVLASRFDGEQELANIEKLQRISNTFSNQGFKTLYDYVNFLKDAITKLDEEAQAGLASQSNAVSILTLHQAKGLEFPVVFLYKCNEVSQKNTVRSKYISVDKKFGLLTKIPVNGDYFSDYKSIPLISIRDYIETKKELAEIKRLFYVGVTRAKQYLFLSATLRKNNKFNPSSFMRLLIDGLNINLDLNEFIIEDDLKLLRKENNGYKNIKKLYKTIIPIIKEVELPEVTESKTDEQIRTKSFLLRKIEDTSKGEIISATKVASYSQCPLKYKFIYKYGYTDLYNNFRSFRNKVFYKNYFEDDAGKEDIRNVDVAESPLLKNASSIKGQLIHKALQKEISNDNLKKFIYDEFAATYPNFFELQETKEIFIKNILNMLNGFYQSGEHKYLNKYSKYKNESEIYLNEKDYYLYGIIDKLIITDDKYIIVDYKTDDIEKEIIDNRIKYYLNQLNFYVYIVSKLHMEFDEIEIRLIFLKFPDSPFVINYNRKNIEDIRKDILKIIKGILREKYPKNLSHCYECNFSINNKCII